MNIDEEFEVFMEFPDSANKHFVTSVSAKLFAKHCVDKFSEQERATTLEQLLQNLISASCGHYADVETEAALHRAIRKADEFLNT